MQLKKQCFNFQWHSHETCFKPFLVWVRHDTIHRKTCTKWQTRVYISDVRRVSVQLESKVGRHWWRNAPGCPTTPCLLHLQLIRQKSKSRYVWHKMARTIISNKTLLEVEIDQKPIRQNKCFFHAEFYNFFM